MEPHAIPLSSTAYSGKSLKIDYLRGTFAIFVALGHLYDMARLNSNASGWLDVPRSLFGTNWVIGFVVISGFLIESSMEGMLRRQSTVAQYIRARVTRIAPLYYVGLVSALAVEWIGNSAFGLDARPAYWQSNSFESGLSQLFMLQNVLVGMGTFGAFAATSTVAFEVWYYFIWVGRMKFVKHRLPLLVLAVGLVWGLPRWKITNDFSMFWGYWLIGAYAYHYRNTLAQLASMRYLKKASYFLLVLFMASYLVFPAPAVAGYYWVLALLFALCLLKDESPKPSAIRRRIGSLLGDASYPIFIIHGPVGILVAWGLNAMAVNDFYVRYACLLGATAVASYILVLLLERPLMNWRRTV